MNIRRMQVLVLLCVISLAFIRCGGGTAESNSSAPPGAAVKQDSDPLLNKGIGPITSVTLGEIDSDRVEKGKGTFESMCIICHQLDKKLIGPPLGDVMSRRSPEWIMNMILNPEQMLEEDPIAKELLEEYISPMLNQQLTEEQARNVLEYFRSLQ